jgi:hypothetical protein
MGEPRDLREAMRAASTASELVAVDVPEWGRKVFLRRMSVRDQFARQDKERDPKMVAILVTIDAICDESGARLLSDDDLELMLDQPIGVIMPLMTEAARLNGITSKELDEAMQTFRNARS